jgi:hypothetical protein
MNWFQSVLLGAVSAGTTALLGWWIARRWAGQVDAGTTSGLDRRIEAQAKESNCLSLLLAAFVLMIIVAFILTVVMASWPDNEVVLYWLAVAASPAGYGMSFLLVRSLPTFSGIVGGSGKAIYRGGLLVWTLGLLSLALGAHSTWYAEPSEGDLADAIVMAAMSVAAGCVFCALVVVTILQGVALSTLKKARQGGRLNGFQQSVWYMISPATIAAIISVVGGLLLILGIML